MTKALEEMTSGELGALFPIRLVPYDPGWPEIYRAEQAILERIAGEDLVRLSHIGSTAVPGLLSKPTIDMLLEVRTCCEVEALTASLLHAGWRLSPQPDNPPPHRMFLKGYSEEGFSGQAMHLHLRYPDIWEELCFRDYLIAHPDEREAYAALKTSLQAAFPNDRDGYTEAKTQFITERNPKAMAEFSGRYLAPRFAGETIQRFLDSLPEWAWADERIEAVILCGSVANGRMQPDSDVDICVLSEKKADLVEECALFDRFGQVVANAVELHGVCTSVRVWYQDGVEAEFGFVPPKWAALPLDAGSAAVLSRGFCVLCDKKNWFRPHLKYRY